MPFPQPYRGQPRPKYPKPKKQIRDLKIEKKSKIFVIGVSILIFGALFRIFLSLYYTSPNAITLSLMIGVAILFLVITIAIADGLESINKFRRGYDIDVSMESKKEDSNQSDNSTN
jgi:hypothetical protein